MLSALQLPLFLLRPPAAYAVLTTTGRRTGKTRRRCVRAVRRGGRVYVVAIKGVPATGWARNALAAELVALQLPCGRFRGRARRVQDDAELAEARTAYAGTVGWFDYLTWMNWRTGWPSRTRVEDLLRTWVEDGTPLVIDLDETGG